MAELVKKIKFQEKEIEIKGKKKGSFHHKYFVCGVMREGTAYKYVITLTYNGESVSFVFHDSIYNFSKGIFLTESDLPTCFYAFLNDVVAGKMDFVSFVDYFGYDKLTEAKDVHRLCVRSAEKYDKLFSDEFDVYDLIDYMQEKYDL
jgi:hypothetical protein